MSTKMGEKNIKYFFNKCKPQFPNFKAGDLLTNWKARRTMPEI